MKRLAKVALIAALVGLVGCEQQAKSLENIQQFKQEIAEKQVKMEQERIERNIGKQWIVKESVDKFEDTKNVRLVVMADRYNGGLDNYPGLKEKAKYQPMLFIDCEANTTRMFVDWNRSITNAGDTTTVKYRIGEQKAVKAEWWRDTNYKALGLWNGKKAIPVIKKMLNEKQFIIEVTPEAGAVETAEFNIEGLEKHIDKVKNACHWN